MKKIALVMTFIGKLSSSGYFDLYLKSCETNKSIDFYIFTNDASLTNVPANVHIVPITMDEFVKRASETIGFPALIDKPYKICDYKVVYGDIFSKELQGYDFWGYHDCDLIFGDIRAFLTDELLDRYDKLLTMGHLTLIRNVPEVSQAYKKALKGYNTDYKTVFTHPGCYSLSEWGRDGGINRIFRQAGLRLYESYAFDDICYYHTGFRPEQKRQNPPYYEMRENAYEFVDGKTFRVSDSFGDLYREEVLYVHFQKRKMAHNVKGTPDRFIMIPNSFEAYQPITLDMLHALPKDKLDKKALYDRRMHRIKLRLKSTLKGC